MGTPNLTNHLHPSSTFLKQFSIPMLAISDLFFEQKMSMFTRLSSSVIFTVCLCRFFWDKFENPSGILMKFVGFGLYFWFKKQLEITRILLTQLCWWFTYIWNKMVGPKPPNIIHHKNIWNAFIKRHNNSPTQIRTILGVPPAIRHLKWGRLRWWKFVRECCWLLHPILIKMNAMAEGKKLKHSKFQLQNLNRFSISNKLVELLCNKTRNPSSETGGLLFHTILHPAAFRSFRRTSLVQRVIFMNLDGSKGQLNIGWLHWLVMAVEVVKLSTTHQPLRNWLMNLQTTTDMAKPGFKWIGPQAANSARKLSKTLVIKLAFG